MQISTTNSNSRIAPTNPAVAYQSLRDSIYHHDPIRWESRFRAFRASLEAFEQMSGLSAHTAYIKCRYSLLVEETDRGIAEDMSRHGWEVGVSRKARKNNGKWIGYKRQELN